MAGKLASRARGLSEAGFHEAYGSEEQSKFQCRSCREQVSLTAGTIFHATKLPLTSWFLAMWLIATARNGISSVELGRRLGIRQANAGASSRRSWQ